MTHQEKIALLEDVLIEAGTKLVTLCLAGKQEIPFATLGRIEEALRAE